MNNGCQISENTSNFTVKRASRGIKILSQQLYEKKVKEHIVTASNTDVIGKGVPRCKGTRISELTQKLYGNKTISSSQKVVDSRTLAKSETMETVRKKTDKDAHEDQQKNQIVSRVPRLKGSKIIEITQKLYGNKTVSSSKKVVDIVALKQSENVKRNIFYNTIKVDVSESNICYI